MLIVFAAGAFLAIKNPDEVLLVLIIILPLPVVSTSLPLPEPVSVFPVAVIPQFVLIVTLDVPDIFRPLVCK